MKRIVVNPGDRYGMLVVVREIAPIVRKTGYPRRVFECRCDCGNISKPALENLRGGATRSCGCQCAKATAIRNTTHGKSGHPAYQVWKGMVGRCHNPKFTQYHDYGGRGIGVCDEWRNDPASFLDWADRNGHVKGMEIERSDNNKGYSPENCQFVTSAENKRNTRRSYFWHADGVAYETSKDAAAAIGVSIGTIVNRCNSDNFPSYWRVLKYKSEGSFAAP